MGAVTNHTYVTSPHFSDSFLPSFDVSVTITAPAAQFGAIADVELSKRISLRTFVECRRTYNRHIQTLDLPAQNSIEVMTGLAVRLWAR